MTEKIFENVVQKAKKRFENVQDVLIKSKVSGSEIVDFIVIYLAAMRKADKEGYDLVILMTNKINIIFKQD